MTRPILLLLLLALLPHTATSNCPPSVVSSFEELHEYCPDASAEDGNYKCYKHDRVVCRGTLDHRTAPPCSKTIRDCSDESYLEVCAFGHKHCEDFTFVCWDKHHQWCHGTVEPDRGTRARPVCPRDEELYDCGELYRYGLNVDRDCDCSGFFGGPVQYECRDKSGHTWCSYRSGFFSSHWSSGSSSHWALSAFVWPVAAKGDDSSSHSWQRRMSGLFVLLVIAVSIAGILYRYRNKKTRVTLTLQPPHEGTALL